MRMAGMGSEAANDPSTPRNGLVEVGSGQSATRCLMPEADMECAVVAPHPPQISDGQVDR